MNVTRRTAECRFCAEGAAAVGASAFAERSNDRLARSGEPPGAKE